MGQKREQVEERAARSGEERFVQTEFNNSTGRLAIDMMSWERAKGVKRERMSELVGLK